MGQRVEHKGDFGRIAEVVEHGRGVFYAAATAEMGNHAVPTALLYGFHQFDRVMALAAAFQSVEQNHQRRIRIGAVDKIVGNLGFAGTVGQKLAAVVGRLALQQLGKQGLGMAVSEPIRRVG